MRIGGDMIHIILKTFKMHKKKSALNIIQFSIAFLSLMLSICMIEQVLEYKKSVESVMDLNKVQMSVLEEDIDEEPEEITGIEPPENLNSQYSNIFDKIRMNDDTFIGMIDSISVYDEESNEIPNAIMVNYDFVDMAKWNIEKGSVKDFIQYNNEGSVPVIISYSLSDTYKINQEYNIEYMAEDDVHEAVIKVVAVTSEDSYMFMGNATYITETTSNKNGYMMFPQIMDFSDLAYEYNVIIDKNNKFEELQNKISEEYSKIGKEVQFISLESQVNQYYSKQKTVILATMVFAVIIILLSLLGTIGTILSSIILRKREFGIYYSMGLSKKNLLVMILGEGVVMFFISFLISTVGSLIITYFMRADGFKISIWNLIITMLVMIICMLICEWMPMRKISSQEPVDLINERTGK